MKNICKFKKKIVKTFHLILPMEENFPIHSNFIWFYFDCKKSHFTLFHQRQNSSFFFSLYSAWIFIPISIKFDFLSTLSNEIIFSSMTSCSRHGKFNFRKIHRIVSWMKMHTRTWKLKIKFPNVMTLLLNWDEILWEREREMQFMLQNHRLYRAN